MKQYDVQLSKTVSYILRHQPWLFELEPDEEGWVPLQDLLCALHSERRWQAVEKADLERIIELSDKQRFEIKTGQIRALYGHSFPGKLKKTPAEPPAILYHGTTDRVIDKIMADGLKPMSRHYVHLSVDMETARQVAARKHGTVILLMINALQAHRKGIRFYEGNDAVWLADAVPPIFLIKM